ncbi:hypothetical protein QAD02_012794 [Eretmocerus hayati]|uniref:Uncharacterized protein n=1 Tax=Eretmocerus hayati TaxID=131215 RepID=A0ACC2P3K0_9HYME|nr:hypothetical protein QAD02_012794 [Eretmocerus hayati]
MEDPQRDIRLSVTLCLGSPSATIRSSLASRLVAPLSDVLGLRRGATGDGSSQSKFIQRFDHANELVTPSSAPYHMPSSSRTSFTPWSQTHLNLSPNGGQSLVLMSSDGSKKRRTEGGSSSTFSIDVQSIQKISSISVTNPNVSDRQQNGHEGGCINDSQNVTTSRIVIDPSSLAMNRSANFVYHYIKRRGIMADIIFKTYDEYAQSGNEEKFDELRHEIADIIMDQELASSHVMVKERYIIITKTLIICFPAERNIHLWFEWGDPPKGFLATAASKFKNKGKRYEVIEKCSIPEGDNVQGALCLCRYLGLIVGHRVSQMNKHWQMYLKLRQVVDIVTALKYVVQDLATLRIYLREHNTMYFQLYGDLEPKMHLWLHYLEIMELNGPAIHFWSMPFEQKNKDLRSIAVSINCKKNLPWSVAFRYQITSCEIQKRMAELVPVLKFGTECRKDVERLDDIEIWDRIPNAISYNWVKYLNIKYEKGSVISMGFDDDGDPLSRRIEKVIVKGWICCIVTRTGEIDFIRKPKNSLRSADMHKSKSRRTDTSANTGERNSPTGPEHSHNSQKRLADIPEAQDVTQRGTQA